PMSDENWVVNGVRDAWDKMKPRLTPPVTKTIGPCGDKIAFTFEIDSQTRVDGSDLEGSMTTESNFNASIQIAYNAEKSKLEGVGQIKWTKYTFKLSIPVAIRCDMPAPLKIVAPEFTHEVKTGENGLYHNHYKIILKWDLKAMTQCDFTYEEGRTTTGSSPYLIMG